MTSHPITRMAKRYAKVFATLLLVLMAMVSLAGQDSMAMTGPAAPPAGCHQHGAKPPTSTPVSYRCCQSGHNSAILQTSLTTLLCSPLVSTGVSIPTPITVSTQGCLHSLILSSPDPPLTIPLRV